MNRLSICIQKGGSGKTTLTINVAGALNRRGHDVLVVDLDPQGALTEGLGFAELYDKEPPTLYDALTDSQEREVAESLIVSHEEMDLLPSSIWMTAAEPELTVSRRGGEQLDLVLDELDEEYDVIIVDSPPYLGYLIDNALVAAQNILIPALAERTSMRGLELMYDHIDELEREYEISIEEIGLVANRVEETNEAEEMMEWFRSAFDDVPVFEVRKRVALQRAFNEGVSIFEFDDSLDMADVFLDVAQEVEAHLGLEDRRATQ